MLTGFRFVHPVELRFSDLDAMGHVNNAVYLTYLESARIAWWAHVTGSGDPAELRMILARAEIDYRSPARFDDRPVVGVRCASLGRSSFVLDFRVEDARGGRLLAEAKKVLVYYDYATRRPAPLPAALRSGILAQDPDARGQAAAGA